MGELADALQGIKLKAVCCLRMPSHWVGQELKAATAQVSSPAPALSGQIDQKALLGSGSFKQQNCGHAQEVVQRARDQGVLQMEETRALQGPRGSKAFKLHRHLWRVSAKKELVAMLKQVLGL